MSRSNPTETLTNPAVRFYEWSGSEGKFKYYDKEAKENVFVELPFSFIVLDQLHTTKGYNEKESINYWSNEVRNTKEDIITVRSKAGVVYSGTYEQCKEKLSSKGLDYVQSVYIAFKEGKELIICNIQLKGSALGPFIEFSKSNKLNEIAVSVKSFTNEKKGATKYMAPVYTAIKISDEMNEKAIELDKQLQEFLKAYLAKNKATPSDTIDESQDNGLNESKSNSKSAGKGKAKKEEATEKEDENDIISGDIDEEPAF